MDYVKLRSLAGLPRLNYAEAKQLDERLSDVKAKTEVPDGTFTKKAKSIVNTLVKLHDGDKKKALKALVFYINRAGKDVSNAGELEKAKAALKESIDFAENNIFRIRAGLTPLVEAKEEANDDESAEVEDEDKGAKEEDEDDLPSIVKKLAKKAVGKEEEELEELLMKVYEAGFSDGKKAKDEESDESAEDEEGKDKKAKEKDAE